MQLVSGGSPVSMLGPGTGGKGGQGQLCWGQQDTHTSGESQSAELLWEDLESRVRLQDSFIYSGV